MTKIPQKLARLFINKIFQGRGGVGGDLNSALYKRPARILDFLLHFW
jgi:hypothetical protein